MRTASMISSACLGLAVVSLSCASTSLSAPDARLPVLVGPVPCIDCTDRGTEHLEPIPWLKSGSNRRSVGAGPYLESREKATLLERDLTDPKVDPCAQDLRVLSIRAHAWALFVPLIFYISDLSIDADVGRVFVAGGSCLR